MFREPILDKIKLPAVAVILALLLGFGSYAAVELPDDDKTGSICVTLTSEDTGESIRGGSLTLYKVGEVVHDDDWNYSFRLTDEFTGSGCSLDDTDKRNAEIAEALAGYAGENDLEGLATLGVDSEGKVYFTGLHIGLYLLVQTEASEGYRPVNPFIVSVPVYDEKTQTYKYLDIDAFPKTEPAQKETLGETQPTPDGTNPSGHSSHSGSGGSSGSHSGGSSVSGPGVSDGDSGESTDIWDILLPATGESRAVLFGVSAFAISAMALAILLWKRKRES